MRVYVVVEEVPYEGGTVMGVYSTRELAEEEAKGLRKNSSYNDYEIEEFSLDDE